MLDKEITEQFGFVNIKNIKPLSTGLINNSYAIESEHNQYGLLQEVNTSIFLHPEHIQENYEIISHHFTKMGSYQLPKIIKTVNGDSLLYNGEKVWRCFEYFKDTYSPLVADKAEEAYTVAKCFGKFSADLSSIDIQKFHDILPGFHDLSLRFDQFKQILKTSSEERRFAAATLINLAIENEQYVKWYKNIRQNPKRYPLHILHQDCKIANILFYKSDASKLCPIDLDTTQPGLFFSDIGDMIRSMVPNISENETNIDSMELRIDFYDAIKNGYLEAMSDFLTNEEKEDLDISGNIIIYMQALRFLTDYLNGDIYYKTTYTEQNKDRAANQFRLLQLLQTYQEQKKKIAIKA